MLDHSWHPDRNQGPIRPLRTTLAIGLAVVLLASVGLFPGSQGQRLRIVAAQVASPLDLGAWGTDHVGQAVPEFTTGDECLFCHRPDQGPGYAEEAHSQSLRPVDPVTLAALLSNPALKAFAAEVVYELGGPRHRRFLKPAAEFGQLDLLNVAWSPAQHGRPGVLIHEADPSWDSGMFGKECAGCHSTGVDSGEQKFSAVALDCYTCHGVVSPGHTRDRTLVHLSPTRRDPPRVVISICMQCHARSSRSRKSGLPYPNNFVAGDNLFRDFSVDFSPLTLPVLHPADRHLLENARDVVQLGKETVTCLSCHDVHRQSTLKHRRLVRTSLCLNCHDASGAETTYAAERAKSTTCRY